MHMMHLFQKGVIIGIGLAVGIVLVAGFYFVVRAVAPGSITNPAFGPLDDDVTLQITWDPADCVWTSDQCNQITCAQDEIMVGHELQHNENCGGVGNDYDFESSKLYCCKIK